MIINKLRFVAVDYIASLAWTLNVYTDIPGPGRALIATLSFPARTERGLVRLQLPGNTRTVSIEREFIPNPSGDLAIYGVQWFRRPLGGASGWSWWGDPDIPPTPDNWTTVPLHIEGTSEQWQTQRFPIEGTSDQWSTESLGIDESGTKWRWVDIPGGESS